MKRIGDDLMFHLLLHTYIFVEVPLLSSCEKIDDFSNINNVHDHDFNNMDADGITTTTTTTTNQRPSSMQRKTHNNYVQVTGMLLSELFRNHHGGHSTGLPPQQQQQQAPSVPTTTSTNVVTPTTTKPSVKSKRRKKQQLSLEKKVSNPGDASNQPQRRHQKSNKSIGTASKPQLQRPADNGPSILADKDEQEGEQEEKQEIFTQVAKMHDVDEDHESRTQHHLESEQHTDDGLIDSVTATTTSDTKKTPKKPRLSMWRRKRQSKMDITLATNDPSVSNQQFSECSENSNSFFSENNNNDSFFSQSQMANPFRPLVRKSSTTKKVSGGGSKNTSGVANNNFSSSKNANSSMRKRTATSSSSSSNVVLIPRGNVLYGNFYSKREAITKRQSKLVSKFCVRCE